MTPGENVLAIHGLDVVNTSSDFLISPRMVGSGRDGDFGHRTVFSHADPDSGNELGVVDFIEGETEILKEHGFYDQPITVPINNNSPGLTR